MAVKIVKKDKNKDAEVSVEVSTVEFTPTLAPAQITSAERSKRNVRDIVDLQPMRLYSMQKELKKFLVQVETRDSVQPLGAYFDYSKDGVRKRLAPTLGLVDGQKLVILEAAY